MSIPLRFVDLFAGCGGLTEGLKAAGQRSGGRYHYQLVAAVESDLAAAATYAANFGRDHLHAKPIEDWEEDQIPETDVVVGGPPCQGFSTLGLRNPEDPRNLLWRQYLRVLLLMKPKYFIIENVAAFFRSPQWEILKGESDVGQLKDYALQAYVLNAAEFGVPQVRKRAIVLGRHRDLPPLAEPVGPFKARPENWITVASALAEVPRKVERIELPQGLFEINGHEVPGAFKTTDLHLTRTFTPLSRQRFEAIPPGGNRCDLPIELLAPCWKKHHTGSMDVMGRLRWGRPSVTIRTEFTKPEKGRYLHPSEHRPITQMEAALLQTFPRGYQWCGSKSAIARQIGNAVPVLLARALGNLVAEDHLSSEP